MRKARLAYQHFEDLFKAHRRLPVAYEDLIENQRLRPSEGRRICDFFGISDHPMQSSLIKMNPESLQAMVSNYDELASAISETEFASLLDTDPGEERACASNRCDRLRRPALRGERAGTSIAVAALHGRRRRGNAESSGSCRRAASSSMPGDVGDPESLQAAMRGADCVCHFASAFRETGVPDDYFRAVNVTGTGNAVEAAAGQGVRRFVLCSTAGIYGSKVPGITDESAPVRPANIYERARSRPRTWCGGRPWREAWNTRSSGRQWSTARTTSAW